MQKNVNGGLNKPTAYRAGVLYRGIIQQVLGIVQMEKGARNEKRRNYNSLNRHISYYRVPCDYYCFECLDIQCGYGFRYARLVKVHIA